MNSLLRAEMKEIDPLKYSKGNRFWLAVGFVVIGSVQGLLHWDESHARGDVTDSIEKFSEQIEDLRIGFGELKTTVEVDEKQNADFKQRFSDVDAALKKIELNQAVDEATKNKGG